MIIDHDEEYEEVSLGDAFSSFQLSDSPERRYRESLINRTECLNVLRDRRQREWQRDVRWLCEDVQVSKK